VDLEYQVPVVVLHVLEAYVAQDAGVVDEHVDTAEALDGSVDDAVAELDRVVVGHGLAAGGLDLVDDDIGSLQLLGPPAQPVSAAMPSWIGGEEKERPRRGFARRGDVPLSKCSLPSESRPGR